jgi:hypothetical protein
VKPHAAPSHAAPASHTGRTHAEPAATREFAGLLGRPLAAAAPAPAAEPSLFDSLLAGPLASGRRRRLVICSMCGEENCFYSHDIE